MSKNISLHLFIVVTGLLIAITLTAHVPVAAQTMVDIATDATDPANLGDAEPSIAVNPRNPREISIIAFSEPWSAQTGAPVWRSTDGGVTWTKIFVVPQPPRNGLGPSDQHLGYDDQGNLFIVALEDNTDLLVNYIFRPNGGNTHMAGQGFGNDQPILSVGNSLGTCARRVYAAWLNTTPVARSMVSHSLDSGARVDDTNAGDNALHPNRTTRIAAGGNGRVYAVYKTREGTVSSDFERAHFRVIRSDDCGLTWNGAGVSVHGEAQVQTWFTNGFGNSAKGKVNRARSSDAWIAVDPRDNDVYVAYVNKDASGFGQIYVARSTDGGATWTSSRVTDGTNHSAFPEIAVADNGAIGVLYIDYDDSGSATIFRHKFARSTNDGVTWTRKTLQDLNPSLIPEIPDTFIWGDYEGLTAVGNTFFGVFTGQSTGRTKLQLDPIFFTEPATP